MKTEELIKLYKLLRSEALYHRGMSKVPMGDNMDSNIMRLYDSVVSELESSGELVLKETLVDFNPKTVRIKFGDGHIHNFDIEEYNSKFDIELKLAKGTVFLNNGTRLEANRPYGTIDKCI